MKSEAYEIHCRFSLSAKASAARLDLHTTFENLQDKQYNPYYHIALFPYHDYVIFAGHRSGNPHSDVSSAVYRFDSADHSIEGPVSLLALFHDEFDDMGDAVKHAMGWCELNQAHELMTKGV